MVKTIDVRNASAPGVPSQPSSSGPASGAVETSPNLPWPFPVKVSKVNPQTGNAGKIVSEHDPAVGKIDQALNHVRRIAPALGFTTDVPPQFVPDPHIQSNSSGTSVVHLHQLYHGVPVFQMARDVRFTPTGTIKDVVGGSVRIPSDVTVIPSLAVKDAFRSLLEFIVQAESTEGNEQETDQFGEVLVKPDMSEYASHEPKVIATFSSPSRPTVFEQGPFDKAPCGNLVIFNQHPQLHLGWHFAVSLSDNQGDYDVVVAAGGDDPGRILYSLETTNHLTARGMCTSITVRTTGKWLTFRGHCQTTQLRLFCRTSRDPGLMTSRRMEIPLMLCSRFRTLSSEALSLGTS